MNITYYLGAGASFNALPLYSNFVPRLELFRDFVFHVQKNNSADQTFLKQAEQYLESLDLLITKLDPTQSNTVDALAQELYNQRNSDPVLTFDKLKYLISDFFVFEQLDKDFPSYKTQMFDQESLDGFYLYDKKITTQANTSVDPRYRTFLNALVSPGRYQIRADINFISWNYDQQMEIALSRIMSSKLYFAQSELQAFPSPPYQKTISIERSSLIKLNGTAGISYDNPNRTDLSNFIAEQNEFRPSYIKEMVETFSKNNSRNFGSIPFFTFSFEGYENKSNRVNAIQYANEIMSKTEVLIVIGYSFHAHNRVIDKMVFENAKKLSRIIVQVPDTSSFNDIRYNLERITHITPEHYSNTTEFLPYNNI